MTKIKHIAILGTAYPYRGGLAAYNERLARQFILEGYRVTIYTFSLQYPGFLFPGKTQLADWEKPSDLDIRPVVNSINPLNWILKGREIKKLAPDILIIKYWLPFMSPCFGTIARIVRKNGHTRVISILDNIIPHEKRFGDTLLSSYFVKPIDAFVAMSESVLNDLRKFDTSKPRAFSPHPLFDNFGEPVSKNEAKSLLSLDKNVNYLLFFGFIRAYKGLDLLLDAFADERLKALPLKLIIAGEFYEDGQRYFDQIKQLELEDRILLHTDFINDNEVYKYFCAADLIAQPYKSATQSGVTQIGFHFGKPMLVTDVGGLKEIIHHGKTGYVTLVDKKSIADAICDFYENNREEGFSANVIAEKKKYEWSKMTNTILNL